MARVPFNLTAAADCLGLRMSESRVVFKTVAEMSRWLLNFLCEKDICVGAEIEVGE